MKKHLKMLPWEHNSFGHPCFGTVSLVRAKDRTIVGAQAFGTDKATGKMLSLPDMPLEAKKLAGAEVEVMERLKVEVDKLVQRHQRAPE